MLLVFWFAVPVCALAFWFIERWPRAQPWFAIATIAWSLYGLFIAAVRQIGNVSNQDLSLFLKIVLPALLVGGIGAFIGVRLGWQRFQANRRR
ncbi:MAG: hypothetical protein QM766_06555 [Burkholderiaceae bacterium]